MRNTFSQTVALYVVNKSRVFSTDKIWYKTLTESLIEWHFFMNLLVFSGTYYQNSLTWLQNFFLVDRKPYYLKDSHVLE